MRVKVYVVDFELPLRVKRWGLRLGIPAATLLVGGIAFAGLPGGYADGQPLTAAVLAANFNALQGEITAIQSPVVLEQSSDTNQTGVGNQQPLPYTAVSVALTPGTWLVQGFASVTTTGNADTVQIGLYDATNGVDVTDSRSAMAGTGPTGACPVSGCETVSLSTAKVIAVTADTTVEIIAYPNGASTVEIGVNGSVNLTGRVRLFAMAL